MVKEAGDLAKELEGSAYEIICWLKKWGMWDATIYSGGKRFSSFHVGKEQEISGWRGLADVWVAPCRAEDCDEYFQYMLNENMFTIDIGLGIDLLNLLFKRGLYAADFDCLPDDAQMFILRHINLFESCVNWYDEYLECGEGLDDTEFDSFDEYWELESDNQEEFKHDLLKACLYAPLDDGLYRRLYGDILETDYNKKLAELILREFEEILEKYHLQYWADQYTGMVSCHPSKAQNFLQQHDRAETFVRSRAIMIFLTRKK